jgi:ABC-type spermidine/putrescine transport system permease subunit I
MSRAAARMLDGSGARWLLALPALFLTVFLAVPLGVVVAQALSDIGVSGFGDVVSNPLFTDALRRTALLALTVTAICWPLALVFSLAIVLGGRVLRAALLVALLLTFWISILVRTYGWVLLEQGNGALDKTLHWLGLGHGSVGLLGTTAGMYPAMVHVMQPFMVLPVLAALSVLDPAQVRAAQSLGAGPLRVLWSIVLPSVRRGSIAGATLVFILSFGFFVTPALLGGPSDLTIATLINHEFNQVFDTGTAAAMGTILIVAVLGAYVVLTRVFRLRLTLGAS